MTMSTEEASKLIFEALAHGVAGDRDNAIGKLNSVCEDADGPRMYGVCCALAGAGAHMLRRIYGDKAPKTPEEGMFVLQELQPGAMGDDPAKAFSVRFLTAWANGDTDTTDALFTAATRASGEQYIGSVCALFADVIGITRLALDQDKTA
ncbi:hypothetical protein ACH4ZX_03655 [Streptomyces sp. NPDC020490]|uniref:hypothetical protein n=1 Tax=Streptomyces sp. NPDC020490 TaxID=3365078 RepID=UPI00379D5B74